MRDFRNLKYLLSFEWILKSKDIVQFDSFICRLPGTGLGWWLQAALMRSPLHSWARLALNRRSSLPFWFTVVAGSLLQLGSHKNVKGCFPLTLPPFKRMEGDCGWPGLEHVWPLPASGCVTCLSLCGFSERQSGSVTEREGLRPYSCSPHISSQGWRTLCSVIIPVCL